jgi:pentatricopeptide repeat protein
MAMRSAAIEGNFQLSYNLFYKAYDKSTKAKKKSNRRESNLPTPSKGPPKSLQPFKTLLTAFKNSEDMLFQHAYLVINMIEDYKMKPDASVYNIIMRACEKDSRWRRCIALFRDMKNIHKIIPNALTYEIIIDCCRHSLETPALIFETLRLQNMPREFCYKAAVCNAGNRISSQVLHETLYSLEKFNTADANAYVYKAHNYDENSTIQTNQSIDDFSILSFPELPKFKTKKQGNLIFFILKNKYIISN